MAVIGLDPVLPTGEDARHDAIDAVSDVRPRLSLLRQGALGDLTVVVAAVLAVVAVDLPRNPALVVLGVVAAWLLYSFAAQPAFERAVSFTPLVRFAQLLGALAVGAVVLGVADEGVVQQGSIALAATTAVKALSIAVHRRALRRTPTVLVGAVDQVDRLAARWAERRDVVVVDTYGWSGTLNLVDHRAGVTSDILASVAKHQATSVVIAAGSALASPALRHLAWALQRAQVECLVVADMNDHTEVLRPRRIGDQVALSLRAPSDRLASALIKSAIDRVGAALGLLVLSPLLLAVAIAVRIDSHGPAVFTQVRTGRDGQPFRMYKFRSMVTGAETQLGELLDRNEGSGPLFKMAQDPRITRLGRLLRRTSVDELLQLVNVLKGEMSLVGPRPALPSEAATYDPWTRRRLHVKPGLTGLWQVSGRSSLTWEESVRKDLEYVNHQSLRLDFSILLRTVGAVVRREGAH